MTVNDTLVATLEVDGPSRRYSVPVPAAALVDVRPNTIRIGSAGGAPFSLEGFRLLPPG